MDNDFISTFFVDMQKSKTARIVKVVKTKVKNVVWIGRWFFSLSTFRDWRR